MGCQADPDRVPAPEDLEAHWVASVDDGDPLEALRAVHRLRAGLLDWESHLARAALARGETWETIGAALGISRQAAWERLRGRISGEIEAERARLRAERARLAEQRRKR
jgi:hypothetical protein